MIGPVLLALHTMALYWLACSIKDNPGVPISSDAACPLATVGTRDA